MIATNAYQRIALAVQRPLNFAPILLLFLAVVFTMTYGVEDINLYRYIWIPWLLHGLLTVTAFHPFDLFPVNRSGVMWSWLAAWLYPIGFGIVVFFGRQLMEPSGISIWPPVFLGWMGWFYLRQYRTAYSEAQLNLIYAESYDDDEDVVWNDKRQPRRGWDDDDDD